MPCVCLFLQPINSPSIMSLVWCRKAGLSAVRCFVCCRITLSERLPPTRHRRDRSRCWHL